MTEISGNLSGFVASGLVALALAAGIGIGASSVAQAQDKPKAEVMHWWTSGGEAAAVKVFADQYNKAGGEWVDSAVAGGEAARAAAISRVVGGKPPTAFQFNTGKQFDDLVNQHLLADLTPVAEAGKWTSFLPPAFVKAASREGHFYAVPVNVHGQNWMFYSNAVLAKAGITAPAANWDEMFADLDKIKAAGFIPLAQGGQAWQEAILFNTVLLSKGGRDLYLKVYGDEPAAAVASPEFKAVVDTFGKLRAYVDAGSPNRNWNDATSMVITGKAGVQVMGDWAKGEFIAAGLTAGKDYGCEVGPGKSAYMIGGDVFVFPKSGDGALTPAQTLLATTMLSPDTQLAFNLKKGSVPVRGDVDTSQLDACAKKGLGLMADVNTQAPAVDMLLSADKVGAIQDAVTNFFHTATATSDDFIKAFAAVVNSKT